MSEVDALFTPLALPNGTTIPNRLCKAAMEENMAAPGHVPGDALFRLYDHWAKGGVGLILTGNVMISPAALTGPGAVVLDLRANLAPFKRWAEIGRSGGAQFWMQINHPGRQLFAAMGETPIAPSAIRVDVGKHSKLLAVPRAMNDDDIADVIERFATTATLAEKAGFTGVQIHAAHGYLLSQFLSPLVNRRDDQWGGTIENRARLLFNVIAAVRARVSPGFCVGIKLNSADFQKGGFDVDDAKWVVAQLNGMGVDLIELSGGSYESPAMQGAGAETSAMRREAYFIDFARDIGRVATIPIMVTGGICKRAVAIDALERDAAGFGVAMLGMGRGLAYRPNAPNLWKKGRNTEIHVPVVAWKNKVMASLATQSLAKAQLIRLGQGKQPNDRINPLLCLIRDQLRTNTAAKRYRKWRAATAA